MASHFFVKRAFLSLAVVTVVRKGLFYVCSAVDSNAPAALRYWSVFLQDEVHWLLYAIDSKMAHLASCHYCYT